MCKIIIRIYTCFFHNFRIVIDERFPDLNIYFDPGYHEPGTGLHKKKYSSPGSIVK